MKKLLVFLALLALPLTARATSTVFNPFTGKPDFVGSSSGGMTAGSTSYIQNTGTLQTGATFYVSSGTVDLGLNVSNTNLNVPGVNTYGNTNYPSFRGNILAIGVGFPGAPVLSISQCPSGVASCSQQSAVYYTDTNSGIYSAGIVLGNSAVLFPNSPQINGAIVIPSTSSIRWGDSTAGHYVGFRSSNTVATNNVYVLPASSGTANQVLATDGANNLFFKDDTAPIVSLSTGVSGSLPAANIAAGSLGASVLASSFPVTGVTAGSYTNASLTVDAQGRLSAASSGAASAFTSSNSTFTAVLNSSYTTTSATVVNVSSMVFSIGANENWSFEFWLLNGCDNTGGNKFALAVPSGATFRAMSIGEAATSTSIRLDRMDTSGTLTSAYNAQTNSNGWVEIFGTVTNSATPGTVQLQTASTTAGQTTAINIGSHLNARKM